MVATMEKPEVKIKNEVKFRCKHRDDKGKPGRSMRRFSEVMKKTDGSTYTIDFNSVPHEIQKAMPAYCYKTFNKDLKLPEDLVDKKWAGKLLYDYLKQHPDYLCGDLFEDMSYNPNLDFGDMDLSDIKAAKKAHSSKILLEDQIKEKEAKLKELEIKEKGVE